MLGGWWIQFQVRDAFEMARIVGKNNQLMMGSGGSNQDIKIGDQFTSSAEIGTNFSKFFHDRVIQSQQCEWCKKLAKG